MAKRRRPKRRNQDNAVAESSGNGRLRLGARGAAVAGAGPIATGVGVFALAAIGLGAYFWANRPPPYTQDDEGWLTDMMTANDEEGAAAYAVTEEFERTDDDWEVSQAAETSYGLFPLATISQGTAKAIAWGWTSSLTASVIPPVDDPYYGRFELFGADEDNAGFLYELPQVASPIISAALTTNRKATDFFTKDAMFGWQRDGESRIGYAAVRKMYDVYSRALIGGNVLRRKATDTEIRKMKQRMFFNEKKDRWMWNGL